MLKEPEIRVKVTAVKNGFIVHTPAAETGMMPDEYVARTKKELADLLIEVLDDLAADLVRKF